MRYLLETGNDHNYVLLLTAFSKTGNVAVRPILVDFTVDEEPSVCALAERLLAAHFGVE
jgi:hypothetical protein